MLKAMLLDFASVLVLLVVLVAMLLLGCDENDPYLPEVHGTITVSPSPGGLVPPFEVQFREDLPNPTPVEF